MRSLILGQTMHFIYRYTSQKIPKHKITLYQLVCAAIQKQLQGQAGRHLLISSGDQTLYSTLG